MRRVARVKVACPASFTSTGHAGVWLRSGTNAITDAGVFARKGRKQRKQRRKGKETDYPGMPSWIRPLKIAETRTTTKARRHEVKKIIGFSLPDFFVFFVFFVVVVIQSVLSLDSDALFLFFLVSRFPSQGR